MCVVIKCDFQCRMLIFFLLFAFLQIHASEEAEISAEEFLKGLESRLLHKKEDFNTSPSGNARGENVINVHYLGLGKYDLPKLMAIFDSGKPQSIFNLDFLKTTGFAFDVLSGRGLVKTIKVNDPERILMHGEDFSPQQRTVGSVAIEKASKGTRKVGIYGWDGEKKLCLKRWPEIPSAEIAAYSLFKSFYPTVNLEDIPLPASEVILMNEQVFLVSRFMEGIHFDKILNKIKGKIKQKKKGKKYSLTEKYPLNLDRFQRLAIFCFLTMPEDCRPQNCFIKKIEGTDEYEFVLIDNDRSFGKDVTEKTPEGKHTRAHCVLFCYREMLSQKVTERVYQEIIAKKDELAEAGARLALEVSYHSALLKLFSEKLIPKFKEEHVIWGTPIDIRSTLTIVKRGQSLEHIVRKDPNKTLFDIFRELSPGLADIYFTQEDIADPLYLSVPSTELRRVYSRIVKTDGRRLEGPTPFSASTSVLKNYHPCEPIESEDILSLLQRDLVSLQEAFKLRKVSVNMLSSVLSLAALMNNLYIFSTDVLQSSGSILYSFISSMGNRLKMWGSY